MASIINSDAFNSLFAENLNDAMLAAAEPILEQALEKIEQTMRVSLAGRLVALIDSDFMVETMGHNIRITVKQAKPSERI